jgi:hypothetical protein
MLTRQPRLEPKVKVMSKIPIQKEQGGVVGYFDTKTGIFNKTIKGGLHIYQSPPSLCNDVYILNRLEYLHCQMVHIYDALAKVHYYASMKIIWARGFVIPNYGYRVQRALPLRYWTRTPAEQDSFLDELEKSPQI